MPLTVQQAKFSNRECICAVSFRPHTIHLGGDSSTISRLPQASLGQKKARLRRGNGYELALGKTRWAQDLYLYRQLSSVRYCRDLLSSKLNSSLYISIHPLTSLISSPPETILVFDAALTCWEIVKFSTDVVGLSKHQKKLVITCRSLDPYCFSFP